MAKVMTDDKHYKDIAQTIRDNDVWGIFKDDEGNPSKFKPEEMASSVNKVIYDSYDYAFFDGWDDGYAQGFDNSWYEAQLYFTEEAYNDFWDLLQEGGNRVDYKYAFTRLNFNRDNFKPKYSFQPTIAEDMFNNCPSLRVEKETYNFLKGKQVSMKQVEEEQGIKFDFSKCTNFVRAFAGSLFSDLNVIDMTGIGGISGRTALAFYGGYITGSGMYEYRLKKIEKIIVDEVATQLSNDAFLYQNYLTHIRFEGVIGTNLNFKDSPLDKDSITNIINHLSDNTTGKTLTLNFEACYNAFDDGEGNDWTEPDYYAYEFWVLVNSKPNWNIVLV